jgi:hypothetical protein
MVFALCLAILWEFLAIGELHEDRIVAKGVWILLAIGLLTVVLLAVEFWYALSAHANRNYGGRFKAIVIAVLTLVVAVVVAPYLWLVTWLLDLAWPYCERSVARIDLGSGSSSAPWPAWLVWTLLTAATALVLLLLWSGLRALFTDYGRAVRLLGPKRALLGTLLMCLLRLRLPRRDLFLQAPVISWVPWFALSAVLYSVISIAAFKWTLPLAVAALAVVMGLHVIAPPAWLFLGTSTYQPFAAFHALRQCWRRLGVTLLDRSNPGRDRFLLRATATSSGERFFRRSDDTAFLEFAHSTGIVGGQRLAPDGSRAGRRCRRAGRQRHRPLRARLARAARARWEGLVPGRRRERCFSRRQACDAHALPPTRRVQTVPRGYGRGALHFGVVALRASTRPRTGLIARRHLW